MVRKTRVQSRSESVQIEVMSLIKSNLITFYDSIIMMYKASINGLFKYAVLVFRNHYNLLKFSQNPLDRLTRSQAAVGKQLETDEAV